MSLPRPTASLATTPGIAPPYRPGVCGARCSAARLLCCYSTKVRITVRAGGTVTVREGIGTGIGRSSFPEVAHEMGLKAAETDATKRALATFGNPFGLALYDKDLEPRDAAHQAGVVGRRAGARGDRAAGARPAAGDRP